SSPLYSLLPALHLATAVYGFTVEETLVGATAHAADALGRPALGRVTAGAKADYLVVSGSEALLPLYASGDAHLSEAALGSPAVWRRGPSAARGLRLAVDEAPGCQAGHHLEAVEADHRIV